MLDKRISESSERRANRCQRTRYIHNRQEHDSGGTFTRCSVYSMTHTRGPSCGVYCLSVRPVCLCQPELAV